MHLASQSVARTRPLSVSVLLVTVLVIGSANINVVARDQKPQPVIEATDIAYRIHAQINEQRRTHGLRPLSWDSSLTRIAEKHSLDMVNRNYLSHYSIEGESFLDRYRQGGFGCRQQVGSVIYTGAENIALSRLYNAMTTENGVQYYDWNTPDEIVRRTVEGWMNSPSHRKNILTPFWQQEGVGVVIDPANKIVITENFC